MDIPSILFIQKEDNSYFCTKYPNNLIRILRIYLLHPKYHYKIIRILSTIILELFFFNQNNTSFILGILIK